MKKYAVNLTDNIYDDNYNRFVGYTESTIGSQKLFSKQNISIMSNKIMQLLDGVHPSGKRIIVPDQTITSVLSQIYNRFQPATGDIYARYNIPTNEPNTDNYFQSIVDQAIEVIVSDVKNNIGMEEINSKLSVWTTVYGDFNSNGLRAHPQIKVREKNTNNRGMVQFMNY